MGWTCIEELIWGDKDHKWVRPGTLQTRGPGQSCNTALPLLGLLDVITGNAAMHMQPMMQLVV